MTNRSLSGPLKLIAVVIGLPLFVAMFGLAADAGWRSDMQQFHVRWPFALLGFLLFFGGLFWPMGKQ